VSRESLNQVALKMGLGKLLQMNNGLHKVKHSKSLFGDSLEAIIGAIYLDKGYKTAQKFILQKIIQQHFDTDVLITTMLNYKSILIEWAQKENRKAVFEIIDQNQGKHFSEFKAQVLIDEQPMGMGFGYTKKKAEQDAAKKSCEALALI
jgi:ribonuclease-3